MLNAQMPGMANRAVRKASNKVTVGVVQTVGICKANGGGRSFAFTGPTSTASPSIEADAHAHRKALRPCRRKQDS